MAHTEEREFLVGEMLRARLHVVEDGSVRTAGRAVQIARGSEIAARMMRADRVERPSSMHRVVAEAMTIKETSFFRDLHPFQALAESILPKLIAARRERRTLRLWSAGCATGQEAYSIAILLLDRFPELESWDVEIVATDISRSACAYAACGRYSRLEINRGLSARMLLRFLRPEDGDWAVTDSVRRMVRFRCEDICSAMEAREGELFDLVLMRNVLLYFTPQERAAALAAVHARMKPDAALLLGSSEQADDAGELFEVQFDGEHACYRPLAMQ